MAKTLPKIISIISALVLLFVINTRPLCVSAADTPDLTLVETELSASEVAELVAGEVAVGVILIIVGFIALTYVTLRNVDAPIQFNSTDSFFDKCRALGQYMLDHIDENVKDVIYSVYQFVTAGNITSISSVPKLNLTSVGSFFAKIGAWLGGSLVNNVSSISQGLFNTISNPNPISSYLHFQTKYSGSPDFASLFESLSSIPLTAVWGTPIVNYWGNTVVYFRTPNPSIDFSTITCIVTNNGFYLGTVTNGNFSTPTSVSLLGTSNEFSSSSSYVSWNYDSSVTFDTNGVQISSNYAFFRDSLTYPANTYVGLILSDFLYSLGCSSYYYYNTSLYSSSISNLSVSSLELLSGTEAVTTTTTSDTLTIPISDELVLQIADIAAAAAAGTIATTKDYYDELIAGLALTITSALSGSNFTMPEGDYYIPSLDNIWKYVEYMFSTLGSWIIFAGKCIQCVTVGEGGLSWIFYGGFIFLICGGIVGKILLG